MLLDELETQSICVLREALNKFERRAMLWSIGHDSTVLFCLARQAFLGHAPFRLVPADSRHSTKQRRFSRRDGQM